MCMCVNFPTDTYEEPPPKTAATRLPQISTGNTVTGTVQCNSINLSASGCGFRRCNVCVEVMVGIILKDAFFKLGLGINQAVALIVYVL